jgi:hypothetical protein
MPVTFPPGRLKAVTNPSLRGSLPVTNTIGTTVPAALAACAASVLPTITATGLWISSAANAIRRSRCSFAQRYSIATLRPTSYPLWLRPARNASVRWANPSARELRRNPITGIAGCCARAASGHAAAVLPNKAINSRRLMCSSQAEVHTLPHC